MTEPSYGDITADQVPKSRSRGPRFGSFPEVAWAPQVRSSPNVQATYLDVELEADKEWSFKTPGEDTLFVYIFQGQALFQPTGEEPIAAKQAVLFGEGDTFWVKAAGKIFALFCLQPSLCTNPLLGVDLSS